MKETLICNVASIIASGVISFLIAKCVRPRAKLKITLKSESAVSQNVLGSELQIGKNGKTVGDIAIFKLSISTGFVMGVTSDNMDAKHKLALDFKGLTIKNIKTVNNNNSRFNIPIGRASKDARLVLNINWMRRSTTAEFLVVGILDRGVKPKDVKADLYIGLLRDVEIVPAGMISVQNDCRYESQE